MSHLLLASAVLAAPPSLPKFSWFTNTSTLNDHHAFGQAFGKKYAAEITNRFAKKDGLKKMLEVRNTTAGAALYDAFFKLHEAEFPLAMAELKGLADGSGIPLPAIFLQNIPEEYTACAAHLPGAPPRAPVDACSDLMMCDDRTPTATCAIGHNEDNGAEDVGTLVLVDATFGAASWVAATYVGELATGAFGFSPVGAFGFSLNWVGPNDSVCPGAGRGFVTRAALDAASFDDAFSVITGARMGSGHNYQLYDSAHAKVVNIEVAPRGLYSVRPIGSAPFFHANIYETLSVPNFISNNSLHRIARVAELPAPTSTDDILHILGDQHDTSWPIFHDAASHKAGDKADWTICTSLVDLRSKRMQIMLGNPREGNVVADVPLLASVARDA
jgi:hypothetical protein